MVYKWHFSCQLGDGLCYRSHLLGEPETTIDCTIADFEATQPSITSGGTYRGHGAVCHLRVSGEALMVIGNHGTLLGCPVGS